MWEFVCGPLAIFMAVFVHSHAEMAASMLKFATVEPTALARAYEETLTEVCRRIDCEILFVPLPAKRALKMSGAGQFDGFIACVPDVVKMYPGLALINVPIVELHFVAFSKLDFPPMSKFSDLKPYTVGHRRGMQAAAAASRGLNTFVYDRKDQGMKLLVHGRIDVLIDIRRAIMPMLKTTYKKSGIREIPGPILSHPTYHCINKMHRPLIAEFEAGLREMKSQGAIDRIFKAMLANFDRPVK